MQTIAIQFLPEKARSELFEFYQYLLYKYVRSNISDAVFRFRELKALREKIDPIRDIDIDRLTEEMNHDIF